MKLTDFEIEVMQLFWNTDENSSPEIHKLIIREKQVTYSTVKTIIDRLEAKGALKRTHKIGKTIIYKPIITPNTLQKPMLKKFVDKVFAGDSTLLLNHLLVKKKLTKKEIDFLQAVIDKQNCK